MGGGGGGGLCGGGGGELGGGGGGSQMLYEMDTTVMSAAVGTNARYGQATPSGMASRHSRFWLPSKSVRATPQLARVATVVPDVLLHDCVHTSENTSEGCGGGRRKGDGHVKKQIRVRVLHTHHVQGFGCACF